MGRYVLYVSHHWRHSIKIADNWATENDEKKPSIKYNDHTLLCEIAWPASLVYFSDRRFHVRLHKAKARRTNLSHSRIFGWRLEESLNNVSVFSFLFHLTLAVSVEGLRCDVATSTRFLLLGFAQCKCDIHHMMFHVFFVLFVDIFCLFVF